MEAYYKDRKKQIHFYVKQIRKLAKEGKSPELTRLKKEYTNLLLRPSLKREAFQSESVYLQELKSVIQSKENEFIQLKLDLCYDLHTGLQEFDAYEKEIGQMKKQYEKILVQKKQRVLLEEKKEKEQQEIRQGKLESYPFLELEDKKALYQELEKESLANANPSRKVIAYEIENKELEYRLHQLYEPWVDIKIAV